MSHLYIPRHAARWSLVLALAMPALALAQAGSAPATSSPEPTIDAIYQAAQGGRMTDADAMIARVLNAHPASAKAHFVHSELLAKEGRLAEARAEYAKANELAPGLPFAKPQAVAGLLQRLDAPASASRAVHSSFASPAAAAVPADASGTGLPVKIGLAALLAAAAFWLFRRRDAARSPMSGPTMSAGPAYPPAPSGAPSYAAPSYAGMPQAYAPAAPSYAPSATSGIGGALMTGAAMGLGAVAVEEAVRHFTHRSEPVQNMGVSDNSPPAFGERLGPNMNDDMGGNDFGISDAGSWDSGVSPDDSNGW